MAQRLGAPGDFAQVNRRAQCAVGPHGTAGRLFCRRVGVPCPAQPESH
jgi:hypothetical protein